MCGCPHPLPPLLVRIVTSLYLCRSFREVLATSVPRGLTQGLRGSAFIVLASTFSNTMCEFLHAGPHFTIHPDAQQTAVYHVANATAGGLAGLVVTSIKRKTAGYILGFRSNPVPFTPTELRFRYFGIGAVAGFFLPMFLAAFNLNVMKNHERRQARE